MSEDGNRSVETNQECSFAEIFPELPRLTSNQAVWTGIKLEHYLQPAGETPEYSLEQYAISINVGKRFNFERVVDGRVQKGMIASGDMALSPVNAPFVIRWDREANVLVLHLENELLIRNAQELLETSQVDLITHFAIHDPLIQQIGLALKTELQSTESGGRLYAEAMANALAVHLLRHHSVQTRNTTIPESGLSPHKLRLVTDYIHEHLDQELSLKELAALTQLSQYHFSRAFRRSTGFSPHQYLIQQRVERAKQLLQQGEMTIGEVAIVCGFTHQSHLNRHFKRLTGITPKTCRNS